MKKIRVIQVGIDHDHAAAAMKTMLRLPEVFEVVGFTRCGSKHELFECYNSVTEYTDEEIFNLPDIDSAVIECFELDLTKYAMMAIQKGMHVHMDKPGGTDPDEFDAMVNLAKEKNLVFSTGYMYRHNPCVRDLKKKLKAALLVRFTALKRI